MNAPCLSALVLAAVLAGGGWSRSTAAPNSATETSNDSPAARNDAFRTANADLPEELQELIDRLLRARRIDPDGQQLLRRRAFLRRASQRYRLRVAELGADRELQRGVAIAEREDVQQRLRDLRRKAPAEREREYRALLRKETIDDLTMDEVAELQFLKRRLGELEAEIIEVDRQLDEHEQNGTLSLRAVESGGRPWWDEPELPPLPPARPRPAAGGPAADKHMAELLDKLITRGGKP